MRSSLVATLAGVLLLTLAAAPSTAVADEPEVRALWVDSFNAGLRTPADIDGLIDRAKDGNFNTIIAQVRRNAQTLFPSAEGLFENYVPPAGFDPLRYLLDEAHAEGIEVHAWANIGAVFSGNPNVATASFPCGRPCDVNHLFNQHGFVSPTPPVPPALPAIPTAEIWLTRAHPSFLAGTTFSGYRQSPSGVWFLDLGHPAAAEHTLDALLGILRGYDVDGIHLDYIRYPDMPIASPRPPGVGLPFAIGYNPTSVNRFNAAYGRTAGTLPDPWDASFGQWRRDQVSAFVRRLYLEMNFIRPQAKLSAALIVFFRGPNVLEPRTFQQTEPYYRVFQDWSGWMDEGILDLSIPMVYKAQHTPSNVVQFREWIEFTKNSQYDRHGIVGLGPFLNSLENTLVQVGESRAPSATGALTRGLNFFSYAVTNVAIPGTPLRARDEFFRAVAEHGAYAAVAPFAHEAEVPEMAWKSDPRVGHVLARIVGADGLAADGARVTIRKQGGGPNDESIVQFADGNGYVGGIDLNPGAYRLFVQTPGGDEWVTIPQPVVPGRVTRLEVDLSQPARGPKLRPERVLGAHERTDHFGDAASPAEEWQGREPRAEDIPPEE